MRPARLHQSGGLAKGQKVEFTEVNEHFWSMRNEESGVFVQALNKICTFEYYQISTMKKRITIVLALALAFGAGYALNDFISDKTPVKPLKRVKAIGGIFFKSNNPDSLKTWYRKHLGFNTDDYGTNFKWYQGADSTKVGYTLWAPFSAKTKYFEPSAKDFMFNFIVDDLPALVEQLKVEGVTITDTIETYSYGKFVHIMDPEGNKIELWEPVDHEYSKIVSGITK